MNKEQYEKLKFDIELLRQHFFDICRKILECRYVKDKQFALKYFKKANITTYQINQILAGKRNPTIEYMINKIDAYYAIKGE